MEDAAPNRDRCAARLERLAAELAPSGLEGLLIGQPANIRYLCGFSGSSGLLLFLPAEGSYLLTDFRYAEQAAAEVPAGVAVWIAREGLLAELGGRLQEWHGARRVGFESEWLTVRDRRELEEKCGDRVRWEETAGVVAGLRAVKSPFEVSRIERAAAVAERALASTLPEVEEGMPERDLVALLEYRLRLEGSGPLPFEPIVASGPRSSLPHATPGERRLATGDLLLFDFGASVAGYASDITRTVVLGEASSWQRRIHRAVLEAQSAALEAIAPGRPAREVDRAARRLLADRGLAEHFGHSTGHGLGLEVHETPRLARTSEDVMEAGHVVTVEPGVYLPGRGGVRIEDDVVVEAGGPRLLTHSSRDLIEL